MKLMIFVHSIDYFSLQLCGKGKQRHFRANYLYLHDNICIEGNELIIVADVLLAKGSHEFHAYLLQFSETVYQTDENSL